MLQVTLFAKPECSPCDEVKNALAALQSEIPHQLVEVDIQSDASLHKHYGEKIPVVKVGPYTLNAPISTTDLKIALGAARDGSVAAERKPVQDRGKAIKLHRIALFFARHWLAVFNLFVFIYVGLPFTAPVLMNNGATRPARLVYRLYSPLCHQLAYRSWFLFGEQPAYPLAIANTSLNSYQESTGMDPDDYWGARAYIGNERVGYKVGLCQRDVGIYGGLLLSGLLFGLLRGRLKPLPIPLWVLFGIVPIAIDGGWQFLSALPFLTGLMRESTPLIRTLTGALFGVSNVWMAYPYVEESMEEIRILITTKLSSAGIPLRPTSQI
jgi:uncharacterized membrane protein/glutaredoxin